MIYMVYNWIQDFFITYQLPLINTGIYIVGSVGTPTYRKRINNIYYKYARRSVKHFIFMYENKNALLKKQL